MIGHGLQGHHIKVRAHAVAGDHSTGQLCGLLNIVGSACGGGTEYHFLSRAAAGIGGNLIFQLFLGQQIVVALFHLHGVAKGAGGAGNDGDFLHRSGMVLQGRHQSMADFMIGNSPLFPICEDGVLLLIAGNDHLNTLLQIRLCGIFAAVAHGSQSSLIDNVGKLRA